MSAGTRLIPLEDEQELDRAVAAGAAVLYKHSDRCFTCRRALGEMERLAEERPGLPVYVIDVIRQRPLSSRIAERLDIRHESPQVILFGGGKPVWHGSHFAVTAGALEVEIGKLPGA